MSDLWPIWALLLSRLGTLLRPSNDELLFMNGSTWVQLWSGLMGALLGSVAAALVASYVLRKTLAAQQEMSAEALGLQRRLAADASEKQTELAERQIGEQRAALERQLTEQRVGLEKQLLAQTRLATEAAHQQRMQGQRDTLLQQAAMSRQLDEQRAEAAKARSYEAISGLVAAADACLNDLNASDETIERSFLSMRSAVVRWGLDMDSKDLREELHDWPLLIWQLAKNSQFERRLQETHKSGTSLDPYKDLTRAAGNLCVGVQTWPSANPAERSKLLDILADARAEAEAAHNQYDLALESL